MDKKKLLSRLAFWTTGLALCVIALGAFTRLIDAGLGCPDWPGCYGHLIVPTSLPTKQFVAYKAWAEMIHRYFVSALSLFIFSLLTCILFKKNRTRGNFLLAAGLLVLLIYQIILGQLTVTLKLLPIIVTQHLLGGFLILTLLWLLFLNNTEKQFPADNKKLLPWAIIGCVLVFLQIMLGAWVSTNYASLSCPDFPFCFNDSISATYKIKEAFNIFSPIGINYEGGMLPESVRQTIQMTHRFGALIITVYFMILAIMTLLLYRKASFAVYIILGLLAIQICLGITNVIFKLPLLTAILHNLTAAVLLLTVITFMFQLAKKQRKKA